MVGRTLSHYRIVEELGKGGMGEVYRARDEVLGRDVAIKVLPADFSKDPERLARFEREAKVLAALNHAHIGAIYGLEEDDGQRFLVPELVEGETLAERIGKGPLPVGEAVPLAIQIAEALEAAHEKGVVHRDLKPANVKITPDGEVKVLDFGLAKPFETSPVAELAESPTLTYAPTGVGVILGTAAYMSPEQVRGQEVDKRSDIWAFGVVLWEMLTGKKLFQGNTVSDVLASTLMREPDWEGLPPDLPPTILRVLRRCLVQEPKERLHDIADARIELQAAFEEPEVRPEAAAVAPTAFWLRLAPWIAALLALAAGWYFKPVQEPEPLPTVRFEVPFPEGEKPAHVFRHGVALSPDGKMLAFVSGTLMDPLNPATLKVHVRPLDQRETRPVAGTEYLGQPVFSPDGQWLAVAGMEPLRLVKVPVEGGEPETLCECNALFGVSWGPDDKIILGSFSDGLQRVSAVGGEPEPLTQLNEEAEESSHRLPHFLPNGNAVLFTVMRHDRWFADFDGVDIHVLSLASGEHKRLIERGSDARYLSTGHVVFARDGDLFAVRFDPERLEVTGSEVPVLEGVSQGVGLPNVYFESGAAQISVSNTGNLAYLEGSVFPEAATRPVWVDRNGTVGTTLDVEPSNYLTVRVAPDGKRVLLGADDVWILDLERLTLTRQTFDEDSGFAIWGPGPDEFTFDSVRDGYRAIYKKRVDMGPGRADLLVGQTEQFTSPHASSWTSDGGTLAFSAQTPGVEINWDLWTVTREGEMALFVQSEFQEGGPEFSPDGRWLAYTSGESGRVQIYVRPFPGPGPAAQVSADGGISPVWSADGSELFFRNRNGVHAASVETEGDRFQPGAPQLLFEDSAYESTAPTRSYDVSADGRFLFVPIGDETEMQAAIDEIYPDQIRVVQNWFAEVEEKLPSDR